jgi:hypothetical protein
VRPEVGRIRLSTIGRSIDLRVPSNRAIALLSLGAFLAGGAVGLIRGEASSAVLLGGLAWAGSVFLSWALARETDPDRWASAFFAAAGGLAGVVLLGPPGFLFLFWFVIGLRIINRTSGAAPGALDVAGLFGITLWLGYAGHWTVPILAMAVVLSADIRRFPKALRIGLPLVLPIAAIVLGIARGWRFAFPVSGWFEILVLVAIAVTVAPVIVGYRRVRSVGDRTGEPLKPHRVQWALGWTAAAALILTLMGSASIQELAPVWAALAGTILGWAVEQALRPPRTRRDPQ